MELTGKQKRYLRGLGNALRPVVQIGKEGLTEAVTKAVERALEDHELIKIKTTEGCEEHIRDVAPELAARTRSTVAQTLGRTALLYRRRKENPSIELP